MLILLSRIVEHLELNMYMLSNYEFLMSEDALPEKRTIRRNCYNQT